jgi:predicted metal-dependent HD superfamily phosphohydrolase
MISILPFTLSLQLEAALRALYAEPPRAYHNFSHVDEVLDHMASVSDWSDPIAVGLAILFHDAIYEAGKPGNEAKSAELAACSIAEYLPEHNAKIERVQQLIMLTARHGRLDPGDVDHDAALFLDCDMAILGAAPERYARYERAIADEYRALPADVYQAGRAHFLRALLAKPAIYLSAHFHAQLEHSARANLAKALRDLEYPSAQS